ncbi:MAG TPA: hypothetical protein DCY98_08200 [Nitrospinae bacterium]|nr:hypothetical protein [Nitrospinota bacterium]HLA47690.1 DUF72 domain-containing protein [Nitrospinota bacterium]
MLICVYLCFHAFFGFIKEGKDVYVYFNNDANGYAVINAKELMKIVSVK